MLSLTEEQMRALRFLAQHRGGCTELVLLAQGFTAEQLGQLVYAGLAKLRGARGAQRFQVKITAAGRKVIAE